VGGHNGNIKAAYARIDPKTLAAQNEFTIQLQVLVIAESGRRRFRYLSSVSSRPPTTKPAQERTARARHFPQKRAQAAA
jgi:hypothetical protein